MIEDHPSYPRATENVPGRAATVPLSIISLNQIISFKLRNVPLEILGLQSESATAVGH